MLGYFFWNSSMALIVRLWRSWDPHHATRSSTGAPPDWATAGVCAAPASHRPTIGVIDATIRPTGPRMAIASLSIASSNVSGAWDSCPYSVIPGHVLSRPRLSGQLAYPADGT